MAAFQTKKPTKPMKVIPSMMLEAGLSASPRPAKTPTPTRGREGDSDNEGDDRCNRAGRPDRGQPRMRRRSFELARHAIIRSRAHSVKRSIDG